MIKELFQLNKEEQEEKLLTESTMGQRHHEVWEEFVEPFFTRKQEELFEAFKACSSADVTQLTRIKVQLNILEGMEAHFMHFIQTGKMAQQTLTELEEKSHEH